jgi:hypothetical protein
MFPEFFAVIGNHDDQSVVQNAELPQLPGQLPDAPVIVEYLTVMRSIARRLPPSFLLRAAGEQEDIRPLFA